MIKRYCKEECEFIKDSLDNDPKCLIYKKKLKYDHTGYVRLKKCVRESRDYKIRTQIDDLRSYYDSFVCEMDMMWEKLEKLFKGEK